MTTALLLAAPDPTQTPVEMELWTVTPGLEGFFWGFFILAAVSIPLFWSMARHMRKVDHNARMRELAERESAEPGTTETADRPADAVGGSDRVDAQDRADPQTARTVPTDPTARTDRTP